MSELYVICPTCRIALPTDAKLNPTCDQCRKEKDRG